MKLLLAVVSVFGLALPVFSYSVKYTLSYDSVYDHGHKSLSSVACSNGEHGLLTSGHTTFDSLPSFPYIGGAPHIRSWDSPYCGTCWQLTYTNKHGHKKSVNITAIDTGDRDAEGFNVSLECMDDLTGGHGVVHGRVDITAVRVPKSGCGL